MQALGQHSMCKQGRTHLLLLQLPLALLLEAPLLLLLLRAAIRVGVKGWSPKIISTHKYNNQ